VKEVLIDLYKTNDLYCGLGQFSLNFANEMMHHSHPGFMSSFLIPGNYGHDDEPEIKYIKANFQKRFLPFLNKGYSLWHSLNQFPSHLPGKHTRMVLTIHDLNFLVEKNGSKKEKYLKRLQKNVDRADYITTISDYTRKVIEENIDLKGKQVRTIHNGVVLNSYPDVVGPEYLDNKKFFFTIGVLNRKKNIAVLLPLMKYFMDYHLVIAGNNDTDYGREIREQIDKMGLNKRIILAGKINEREKYWLFSHCEAFLFPSLAEGFGLPVIEAMKVGKPVFLSRFTSLPEIGGPLAFYFNSFEEEQMASFIKEKLAFYYKNQPVLSEKIHNYADTFSWDHCITEYLELYGEILNGN
jgi:glycosyltransferase involved in cell wall biosynthesis